MLLNQTLSMTVSKNANKVFFRFLGKGTTFKEAYAYINRYSYFLQNEIQHGRKVLIFMDNCPHLAYTFFALANTLNISIFAGPGESDEDIARKIKTFQIEAIVVSDSLAQRAKEMLRNQSLFLPLITCENRRFGEYDETYRLPVGLSGTDKDIVCYFETQNSGGQPKWVGYTHKILEQACFSLKSMYRCNPNDSFFSFNAYLGHSFYFVHGLIFPLLSGCSVLISDSILPEELVASFGEARTSRLIMRANLVYDWLRNLSLQNIKIPTFRSLTLDHAVIEEPVFEMAQRDFNLKLLRTYGCTETAWATAGTSFDDPEELPRIGKVLPGVKVRVLDSHGDDLSGKSQTGTLVVSGLNVADKYYENKDDSKLAFRGNWFFTGDYVTLEEDVLTFLDRKENICQFGQKHINSKELEERINACPGVAEAAVISPNTNKKELLVIVVKKLNSDLSSQSFQEYLDGNFEDDERPNQVAFMKEIPHTDRGYIDKAKLRFQFKR